MTSSAGSQIEIVEDYEPYETEIRYINDQVTLSLGKKTLYKIFNGLSHGRKLIHQTMGSAERRSSSRIPHSDGSSVESQVDQYDGEETREHGSGGRLSGPLLSGTTYCISSCAMILLNKVAFSTYNFNAGISLMFYQNLISTLIVLLLGLSGVVTVERFNWKLIRIWIPVNIVFLGMLVSGMYSLKYMNVAMVTILKNATNILTAIGDLYFFRKRQNQKVWTAMFMMIVSAITSGITDLTFDATGYTWQIINCLFTAGYSLTLRWVMDKAKQATRSGSLNEVSMVLLNNALSLPFALVMILTIGEWDYLKNTDVTTIPMFWVVATFSGFLGLAISFTSMWFLHQTSPTTYSLVGSLNKIPLSIAGIALFNVPSNLPNTLSILFGLFAGVLFARAKMSSS